MPPLSAHSLYHRPTCPFCIKVRAAMQNMGIELTLVNVSEDQAAYQALVHEGGRGMVPCLKIKHDDGSVEWMYESDDIIDYLKDNFAL